MSDSSVLSSSKHELESNLGFTFIEPPQISDAALNLQSVLLSEVTSQSEVSNVPSRATPVRTTVLDPEQRRNKELAST